MGCRATFWTAFLAYPLLTLFLENARTPSMQAAIKDLVKKIKHADGKAMIVFLMDTSYLEFVWGRHDIRKLLEVTFYIFELVAGQTGYHILVSPE